MNPSVPKSLSPRPRRIHWLDGEARIDSESGVFCASSHPAVAWQLGRLLPLLETAFGKPLPLRAEPPRGWGADCMMEVAPSRDAPPQGYRIEADERGLYVAAADEAGLAYALATLRQLLPAWGAHLRAFRMEDWPDFPVRGVMLDVSRCKVPTLETLHALVDRLADWKINQLQLYTEHTFRYERHPEAPEGTSAYTADEMRALDTYCAGRGVELVPNQNSFGHLERWLRLPGYRHLAECEGEFETPWGERRKGPFSLNPLDPRCLDLLSDWYDELLPSFSSRLFNVGCDETFDLGWGQSRDACKARGKDVVYLEFLQKVRQLVEARGRTMLFWADILLKYPARVKELAPGVVPLIWGYEADHPFEAQCALVSAAGHPFYVCPGTSSWLSLAGRWENCRVNLERAAEAGLRHDSQGLLITDWGDQGHWQYLSASAPGLLYGAALAWCGAANRDLPVAEVLDGSWFGDEAGVMGGALLALANVYRDVPPLASNRSQVFTLLRGSEEEILASGIRAENVKRAVERVASVQGALSGARPCSEEGRLVLEELRATAGWMQFACERGRRVLERGSGAGCAEGEWKAELVRQLEVHKALWHARNRPGGYAESVALLGG